MNANTTPWSKNVPMQSGLYWFHGWYGKELREPETELIHITWVGGVMVFHHMDGTKLNPKNFKGIWTPCPIPNPNNELLESLS